MADWTGVARSNWFAVKNIDEFRFEVEQLTDEVTVNTSNRPGKENYVTLLADSWDGSWPMTTKDGDVVIDWAGRISPHLVPGHICVIQEVGYEKLRYMTGWSLAINSNGDTVRIDIDDIIDKAITELKIAGVETHVTAAEY